VFLGIIFAAIISISLAGVLQANADTVFLRDGNSFIAINFETQLGTFVWTVDGLNQIFQQWFWFRIGDTGGETSIDNLVLVSSNVSEDEKILEVSFTDEEDLTVDVTWELEGEFDGSGKSTLFETIVITNVGDTEMNMHFFQYTDFDVEGPQGDTVEIIPPNIARQTDGLISETIVSPDPTHFEVAEFGEDRGIIRMRLNDNMPTTLLDIAGPLPADDDDEGVDGTWAFQWDVVIPAGESLTIEKKKEFFLPPSGGGGDSWEPPTIGPDRKGVLQVNDGICINVTCWDVTQDYHVDFELYEMLTGTNTISLEILCPHGVNDCNYVAIGITKPGDNVNAPIWSIGISKNLQGVWTPKIQDPEGRLGEITFTTQVIDNYRLGVSFTIDFKNLPTDESWLWVQLRDTNHGIRNFYFNEGIKFVDSDAYPEVESAYEKPIKVEPLCINESSNHRNSCAFEKVKNWTTQNAQKTLDDILAGNYVYS